MVTIATLVEAKSPVWWHVGPTNHLLVLLNYCLRLRTKKEVEIQDSLVEMGEEREENLAELTRIFSKSVGWSSVSHWSVLVGLVDHSSFTRSFVGHPSVS